MTNQHFYVENARLMGYGLSNLGNQKTEIIISGSEPVSTLAGKLIGAGFHSDRKLFRDQLIHYTKDQNPFIRRSAYIGLSFAGFIDNSDQINEVLEKGFNDPELEVRKISFSEDKNENTLEMPKLNVKMFEYEEEENFLKALKELQKDLSH